MFTVDKDFLKQQIDDLERQLKIIPTFRYRPLDLIRSVDNKLMHLKSILKKIECLELFLKDLNIDEKTFNETYGIKYEEK